MQRLRTNLFCICFFMLLAVFAMATDYYVDPVDGNDGNLGTSEGSGNAWLTLSHAADTIAAADTVYCKNNADYVLQDGATGAILEISTSGGSNTPIQWIGYTTTITDGGSITLDCSINSLATGVLCSISGNIYNTFNNIIVDGGTGDGWSFASADRFVLENCDSTNNGGAGINADDYVIIKGGNFSSNTGLGIDSDSFGIIVGNEIRLNSGGGALVLAINTIAYNKFVKNTTYQIFADNRQTLIGNTFDGNDSAKGIDNYDYMVLVLNNIFTDCDPPATGQSGSGAIIISRHNTYWSSTANVDWTSHSTDLTSDPIFTNQAGNDYTISSASPSAGSGFDASQVMGDTVNMDRGAQQATVTGGGTTVIVIDD